MVFGNGNDAQDDAEGGSDTVKAKAATKKQNGSKGGNNKVLTGKITKAKGAAAGKAAKKQTKASDSEEAADDGGVADQGEGEEGVQMEFEKAGNGEDVKVEDEGEEI